MRLKNLLPYEEYTFVTKLSTTEVSTRIDENTEPRPYLTSFVTLHKQGKLFYGFVLGDEFELSRVIPYRNAFLPLIKGKMTAFLGKTEITIRMAPVLPALIIISVWMGAITLTCLGMLLYGIFNFHQLLKEGIEFSTLTPFLMWIGGAAIFYFGFTSESKRAKELLLELLEGEEVMQ